MKNPDTVTVSSKTWNETVSACKDLDKELLQLYSVFGPDLGEALLHQWNLVLAARKRQNRAIRKLGRSFSAVT